MRLKALLGLGWLVLVGDVVYWTWELGQDEEQQLSTWHADLNEILFYGAPILFLLLLCLSYLAWRINQRA